MRPNTKTGCRLAALVLALTLVWIPQAKAAGIELGLGLSFSAYREETYSSLVHELTSVYVDLGGSLGSGAFRHEFRTGFAMGPTQSAASGKAVILKTYDTETGLPIFSAVTTSYTAVEGYLSYGLAYSTVSSGPWKLSLGGRLRLDAMVQIANYPSVTGVASLGPLVRQTLALGPRDELSLDLSAPLLSYAVRPPFAGADAALMQMAARDPLAILSTGELAGIGSCRALLCRLEYRHGDGGPLGLLFAAQAFLSRIEFPKPRGDARLELFAGAALMP